MKNKNIVTVLLIAIVLVSCAPVAKVVSTETAIPTSTNTPLPPSPTITVTATLSPIEQEDNGILAINSNGKILFYDFNRNRLHEVGSEKGWITRSKVSPNLNHIAYSFAPYTSGLTIRGLYGKQETQIVGPETQLLFFSWAGNDDSLIYATINGVYIYSLDTSSEKIIPLVNTFDKQRESFFLSHASPDRNNFIIEQHFFNDNTYDIYYLSITSREIKKLNDTAYNGGSNENKFGGWGKNEESFFYSADTSLVGSNMRKQNTFVFDALSVSPVEGFPSPYSFAWSPNGDLVSQFQRESRRTIYLNNGDFSEEWNEVISVPSTGGNEFNNMVWSPDGKYLATTYIDYFSPSVRQLEIYDTEKSKAEILVDNLDIFPEIIYWSPDGYNLLITDGFENGTLTSGEGICRFRIYSFQAKELIHIPDVNCYGILSSAWSTDGNFLAFTTASEYSTEKSTYALYLLDIQARTINQVNVEGAYNVETIP